MIDIGLSKLALIGVVALVVIGPERLPKVARMAGSLFGRAQRYINDVKAEVTREIELEELRKMKKDVEDAAGEVESGLAKSLDETQNAIHEAWNGGEASDSSTTSWRNSPGPGALAIKAKNFRKKRLARNSAVPAWYKNQNGRRTHAISAAARVAKFRPIGTGKSADFF